MVDHRGDHRRAQRPPRAGLHVAAVLGLAIGGCSPTPSFDQPTPRPPPLPTRIVVVTATRETTPTPATPSPTAARHVFTTADFDPYAAFYATERDGIYVTTRNPRGRYYYKWDDRRWMTIGDRVWFRSLEDLLTVFPDRQPAP